MKILVTGADGFVGSWLVPALRERGHDVFGAVYSEAEAPGGSMAAGVPRVPLDVRESDSVCEAMAHGWDAVIHLAGVASGGDALADPVRAWEVNAVGTARIAVALGERRRGGADPLLLVVSTAEVYGIGPARPRTERDDVAPCSPYAASKLAGEIAALEVHRRTGLRVVVARAFPHTGPGQDERFVVPAFAARLRMAKQLEAPVVKVGRLDCVREIMHVADVVRAYTALLADGVPGEIYNVASGVGLTIRDLFVKLTELISYAPIPEFDPKLIRPLDIPHLVGDSTKLRELVGWSDQISPEQTLREVLDAQTN